ncbi:MAG: Spx/MgsR family RNA polymerase-binding regulatory protein [Candidatus Acidiferrales bacterium]
MVTRARRKPATRAKKAGKRVKFMQKPSCTTCRKARAYMQRRGFQFDFRDLTKERLSAAELEKLIGRRDHTEFLNTRNDLYRHGNMKEEPPTRKAAIRLMAKAPNLIRRPVIVCGGRVVLGFDKEGIKRL